MVCGVSGCDRWWMSPSRQCFLCPEAASELPVPSSSAGKPGKRRAESLVQEGKGKEWLHWKVASQREVTHNHGRGAVGRAVGGGRQEEDSYRRKEGAAPGAKHSWEGRTVRRKLCSRWWVAELVSFQTSSHCVCPGVLGWYLPSFLRRQRQGLNKTNNQSHHRSLPSRFYTPRGMTEQKSIEKTPTPLMEMTKSVDHLCVEQTFIQHLLIVRHPTRSFSRDWAGSLPLPSWYFWICGINVQSTTFRIPESAQTEPRRPLGWSPQAMAWEILLQRYGSRQAFWGHGNLRQKTETNRQAQVLATESILERGQGRYAGSGVEVDSGKEQNETQRGPSKANGEKGRFQEAGSGMDATWQVCVLDWVWWSIPWVGWGKHMPWCKLCLQEYAGILLETGW